MLHEEINKRKIHITDNQLYTKFILKISKINQ